MKSPIDRLPDYFKLRAKLAKLDVKPYILRDKKRNGKFVVDEIRCKCGLPIRGWTELGADEITRSGNQITVIRRMGFVAFGNYREVELLMSDGNKHVTIVCGECANVKDMDFWTDVYLCDLVQWLDDDDRGETAVAAGLFTERYPVKILETRNA